MKNKLGIIVMDNFKEFGQKVNNHLKEINQKNDDYLIPVDEIRFNNGEGKIIIKETIRGKEVFILSDVGNYSCTYKIFGNDNHMSPDNHFQDIKRVISAIRGNAQKINLLTPLLYASRQHKRKGRESLDCAMALQEIEKLGVETIISFDVHDPNVQNAIPCLSFENFYATHIMLEQFIKKEKINLNNLLTISPDIGAVSRARYYADILGTDVGMFYKRRDLSVVIDGKNPIVAHEYIGRDVRGKDIIVVDDMIDSGNSILEVIYELKERGANNIFVFVTFSFFTKGVEEFNKASKANKLFKIYTTNLTYISSEIKNNDWLEEVDCSYYVAQIIDNLYKGKSLSPLMNGKKEIIEKILNEKNKTTC